MSTVLIISDLHIDASTAGVERYGDLEAALRQVYERARAVEADAVLCLGDLCDPDSPSLIRCVGLARKFASDLLEEGIPSLWLAGNHDVLEDGHGTTTLDLVGTDFEDSETCQSVLVCTTPGVVSVGHHVRVVCLPYTPLSGNYDPADWLARMAESTSSPGSVQLVAGHLMLEGISQGSETADFPRGRDVFFPIDEAKRLFPNAVLLNGHYHDAQVYRGVHVPGALVRLTRADAGRQPGFLEIEV